MPHPLTNRWTGGQYSLYRVVLGAFLLLVVWFVEPAWSELDAGPWNAPLDLHDRHRWPLSLTAVAISIGLFDRWFAVTALIAVVCVGEGVVWLSLSPLLLAHALTDPMPFGSVLAVGRPDPGGGWKRSRWNLALSSLPMWVVSWSQIFFLLSLTGPFRSMDYDPMQYSLLAVATVPALARFARLQRANWILWALLFPVVMFHVLGLVSEGSATRFDVVGGVMAFVIGLACFDPALIPGRRHQREVVYYDGDCGLCHRTVRFLLAEDAGGHFRYAALQGDHFAEHVSDEERASLGDSVIVRTAGGRLLQRSSAVVHLLLALGGLWRVIGSVLRLVPRPLRDLGYDGVAKVRKRIFAAPKGLCPMIPPDLGARFLP